MDKLKKEVKNIKNTLNVFEHALVTCQTGIKDGEKSQEYLELRLSTNEYNQARLAKLERYKVAIDVIYKHLNDTISRVNNIHVYLRNLQCYEVMEDSDDEKPDEKIESNSEANSEAKETKN